MDYKMLIAESWQYTQENRKLVYWLGVFPAFFTTTVGVFTMIYQFFAFKNSYLFSQDDAGALHYVVTFIWDFVKAHISWTLPLVIVGIIFALFYFLFPTLAQAAAIQKIARNRNGQQASVGTGIRHGILSYLPLFEYHLLIKTFAFFSILTEMSFVMRNLGMGIFKIMLPVFIIFTIVSFVLTLLFTYTDFFIVIDGIGVLDSMKKSAKLVVVNWKYTFLITLLMLIIGLRIIIQAVLVFLVPALIVLVAGYLATVTLPVTSIVVGGIVGIAALLIASYLNGVVDVFIYTVWTFTFLSMTQEKEVSARETVADDHIEHEGNVHPLEEVVHKNL